MKYLYLLPLFLASTCSLVDASKLQDSIFAEMYNPPTITISPDPSKAISTNEVTTIINVSSGGGIGSISINIGGTNTSINPNKATSYVFTNTIKLGSLAISPASLPISVTASALKTASFDIKTYSYLFTNFSNPGETVNNQALSELGVNVSSLIRYVNGINGGSGTSYIIEWYVDSRIRPTRMVNARSDIFTGTWTDSVYRENFTTSVQVIDQAATILPAGIYTTYLDKNSKPITDSSTLATINSGMFIELVTTLAKSRAVPTGGSTLDAWSSFTWNTETNFVRFEGDRLFVITITEPSPGSVIFLDDPKTTTSPFFVYTNK